MKPREEINDYDNPNVPNLLEALYNQALRAGRELGESMARLTDSLEEGKELESKIWALSEAESSDEQRAASAQLDRIKEWT